MVLVQEHSIKLNIKLPPGDVHAKMDVFYNPIMSSNRNISILLLNSLPQIQMKIADPLAGSGIRSLRFLQELKKWKIKSLLVNDAKDSFPQTFRKCAKLNRIPKTKLTKVSLKHEEASLLLLKNKGLDYIDIDPFGTPNPFLSAAVAAISRGGILAITATDTAALTGTYPEVTKRKYGAASLKNYLMHEMGLRILIRKVQLQGIQFDKALTPLLAYRKDHYFRVYFHSQKGKEKCDQLLEQQQYFLFCSHCLQFKTSEYNSGLCTRKHPFVYAGPLWTGRLIDQELITAMATENPFSEEQKFLNLLQEESRIQTVGFIDVHEIARLKKQNPLKMEVALKLFRGVRTHFSPTGIKTNTLTSV